MKIEITRLADQDAPNSVIISLPEGTLTATGTPGLVVGAIAALLQPPSIVHALIVEHSTPEALYEAWRTAVEDAGLPLPDPEPDDRDAEIRAIGDAFAALLPLSQ